VDVASLGHFNVLDRVENYFINDWIRFYFFYSKTGSTRFIGFFNTIESMPNFTLAEKKQRVQL
jgi:hypothetical protein